MSDARLIGDPILKMEAAGGVASAGGGDSGAGRGSGGPGWGGSGLGRGKVEKTMPERVADHNLSAAKKAIERLAEARGQDTPFSDPPPNPYVLASTHQASQEKAEADKRQLQDRLQSLAAEYEHTIAELHEHLEYIADDEAKWRRTAEDQEQRLEIAAANEKECEQKLEEYKRQVTQLNLAEQRCQLDKNDLRKSLAQSQEASRREADEFSDRIDKLTAERDRYKKLVNKSESSLN